MLVFPAPGLDDLVKQGKIVADSKVILARSGMGVAVRAGAPKPDISTPEALKRTLLAAKSIVYTDPALRSPSGVHFAKVLERLGIAEEMKAKSKLHNGTGFNAEFVARGEIEIAIQQISEIVPVQGVELVGPLPADLQLTTVYATAIGADAKEQAAAKEFVKLLTSPAAAAVIKATGMEPGGSSWVYPTRRRVDVLGSFTTNAILASSAQCPLCESDRRPIYGRMSRRARKTESSCNAQKSDLHRQDRTRLRLPIQSPFRRPQAA